MERKKHLFIKVFSGSYKIHRVIFNIQIVGGNLAGFDDDQHISILIGVKVS